MLRFLLTDGKREQDWKSRKLPDESLQMRRRLHCIPGAFWCTYTWLYGQRFYPWGIQNVFKLVIRSARWHTIYHPSWGDPREEIRKVAQALGDIAARMEEHS